MNRSPPEPGPVIRTVTNKAASAGPNSRGRFDAAVERIGFMRYRRFFDAAIGQLKNERRYRIFANLERDTSDLPRALYRSDDGTERDVVIWCSND